MNDAQCRVKLPSTRVERFVRSKEFRRFLFCILMTFIWGLAAHAYSFFQDSFSHDSLNALYANSIENDWKLQLGRILVPLYRALVRGSLALPWLIGLLSLMWMGIAVYFTVRTLDIKSRLMIALTAGIFATNITSTTLFATFNYETDVDMFALMAAAGAAYMWRKGSRGSLAAGALMAAVSLALYQSYISVAIALIMFACIFSLLRGEGSKSVFRRGLKAIGMLAAGALVYLLALKLSALLTDVGLDTSHSNSIGTLAGYDLRSLLVGIARAYLGWGYYLLKSETFYPEILVAALRLILFMMAAFTVLFALFAKKRYPLSDKLLALALCLLLPLGMNLALVLNTSMSHYLMTFAVWLTYLLAMLIMHWAATLPEKMRGAAAMKQISIVLIAFMLWANIQTANTLYLKKDMEQEAALSLMTRVACRIEEREDYIPGETPLAFIGISDQLESLPGMEDFNDVVGVRFNSPISIDNLGSHFNMYKAYFDYVLQSPAKMCDTQTWEGLYDNETVARMNSYPARDCIQMIDGVLVVKMGE